MELAYVITTIVITLFIIGTSSIIYSIILQMPVYYELNKKEKKPELKDNIAELEEIFIDEELLEDN